LESLFTVRTNVLLKAIPREANTHYLSGLLIGTEVRSILSQFPASTPILLCGSRALQELYERTFQVLGESFRVHSVPEEISSVAASLGHWSLRSVVDTRVRHGG
jgi:2-dehydro-3-deoxygalactonokinase